MENRKTLVGVPIALLGAACLCGLCLAFSAIAATALSLNAGAIPWPSGFGPASKTTTPAPSPPPAVTFTVTPKPTKTMALAPTLTSTIPMTTTQIGMPAPSLTLFPTMTLTGELTSPEASFTPLPTETPTVGPVVADSWCIPWNAPSAYGLVLDIIDGVTILVEIDGQNVEVRYIGIDLLTDAAGNPTAWIEATEKNRQLVQGKTILLIKDHSETNAAGQLLRYAIVGSIFVNREMVASGYAVASSVPPDTTCDSTLLEAEIAAIASQRGLWAPTPTVTRTLIPLPTATVATTGNIIIVRISYKGTEWQEPEEYVEIMNDSPWPIQLRGWTLTDNKNHVFIFPAFTMKSGDYCRVYTNEYHPTSCGFSYNSPSPIWDDEVDCGYLKDPFGNLVAQYCYE